MCLYGLSNVFRHIQLSVSAVCSGITVYLGLISIWYARIYQILTKKIINFFRLKNISLGFLLLAKDRWVRSRNCGCLITWFCYQLIAKPGNKTAAVSWPDPDKPALTFFVAWISNRMAWQWAETLVEIRGTLADIRGTTKLGCRWNFPKHEFNRPVCLEAHHYLLAHLSQ